MATITIVGALRMVATLASGNGAVMTGETLIGSFTVRKRRDHWCPGVAGMTGVAQVAGKRVIG